MMHFDWWDEKVNPKYCDVVVNFFPNEGIYRGNIYRKGSNTCIGDFISDSSVEIESYFPDAFKEDDEMTAREKIEMIISRLTQQRDFVKSSARNWRHKYDDAKEDGKGEHFLHYLKKLVDEKAEDVKELEMLIDFMQELHYKEVK